ncbi:MAG: hypothetical protein MZV65_46080 [Chromatiales bacterium]|nr:hypothetical protein [Chromatiales bacterium]
MPGSPAAAAPPPPARPCHPTPPLAEGAPRARSSRTHREILGTAPTPPGPGRRQDRRPDREGIVTAILPPKVWRTLERATQDYPHWVAALSGIAGAVRRRGDRPQAPDRAGVREEGQARAAAPEARGAGPEGTGPEKHRKRRPRRRPIQADSEGRNTSEAG